MLQNAWVILLSFFYKICCGEKTGNNISENLQLKFPDREVPFQGLRLNLVLKLPCGGIS